MTKKKEEKEMSVLDFIFPESDVLFKNVLSIFITYYILSWLVKILQSQDRFIIQLTISLITIYVVLTFLMFHLRQAIDFNKFKIKENVSKWKNHN